MKLYQKTTVKEIQEKYGFNFSRNLGQNFLIDKNIIDKIITGTEIGPQDTVLEIGPGMGVITAEAAAQAKKVIAVEVDKSLLPILAETLVGCDNVRIINEDILKLDIDKIIAEETAGGGEAKVIGNLPYYITTPIIMKLLEETTVKSITIMMQKEVADRIKAAPGSKIYGAISVAVQYYCQVREILQVSREAFVPVPKVDSTVLRLDIREEKPVSLTDEAMFFKVVRAGFSQRRKTLLNALSGLEQLGKEEMREFLLSKDIDPGRRAETLSLEEFARIANGLSLR